MCAVLLCIYLDCGFWIWQPNVSLSKLVLAHIYNTYVGRKAISRSVFPLIFGGKRVGLKLWEELSENGVQRGWSRGRWGLLKFSDQPSELLSHSLGNSSLQIRPRQWKLFLYSLQRKEGFCSAPFEVGEAPFVHLHWIRRNQCYISAPLCKYPPYPGSSFSSSPFPEYKPTIVLLISANLAPWTLSRAITWFPACLASAWLNLKVKE